MTAEANVTLEGESATFGKRASEPDSDCRFTRRSLVGIQGVARFKRAHRADPSRLTWPGRGYGSPRPSLIPALVHTSGLQQTFRPSTPACPASAPRSALRSRSRPPRRLRRARAPGPLRGRKRNQHDGRCLGVRA
jgi:hypothetical protein